MLTPREAFKAGFLLKCAELGLSGNEAEALVKSAHVAVKQGFLGSLLSGAKDVGSAAAGLGTGLASGIANWGIVPALAAGIVAPPAIGAGVGYGLGRLTDIDDEDVDSIKQQELIDEYLRNAERLRHRNRRYRSLRTT